VLKRVGPQLQHALLHLGIGAIPPMTVGRDSLARHSLATAGVEPRFESESAGKKRMEPGKNKKIRSYLVRFCAIQCDLVIFTHIFLSLVGLGRIESDWTGHA
jgi:hypothetical protein